jgi:hypothetical protein
MENLTGKVLPESVRALSRYLSYGATLVLVGGAVYSAWVFMRKKILPHRVSSNLLIALGVLLPAIGGGIMRQAGNLQLFYVFELAGIIIIFLGFLRSKEVFGFYRFPLIHGFGRSEPEPVQSGKPAPAAAPQKTQAATPQTASSARSKKSSKSKRRR